MHTAIAAIAPKQKCQNRRISQGFLLHARARNYNLSAKADKYKSGEAPPLVQIIGSANYYNLSAKADKNKSGEALPLVQIIGSANYYNLSAKADKNKSGEALPLVQIIGSANYNAFYSY
jgi:hypothetical protein